MWNILRMPFNVFQQFLWQSEHYPISCSLKKGCIYPSKPTFPIRMLRGCDVYSQSNLRPSHLYYLYFICIVSCRSEQHLPNFTFAGPDDGFTLDFLPPEEGIESNSVTIDLDSPGEEDSSLNVWAVKIEGDMYTVRIEVICFFSSCKNMR